MERLQKYLARAGVASRRKAEALITAGRVAIDGHIVKKLGTTVLGSETITVDGKVVKPAAGFVYYAFHKPKGIITTAQDEQGRKTVLDFLPKEPRVVACGRLDTDSQGLVLLTNDGELCYQLTHPKFGHEKEYLVTATVNKGPALKQRLQQLEQGMLLDGKQTNLCKINAIKRQGMKLSFTIALTEGRNRQVRRMCSAVGLDVVSLTRTRIGALALGDLPPGHWRQITKQNIAP